MIRVIGSRVSVSVAWAFTESEVEQGDGPFESVPLSRQSGIIKA